MTSKPGQPVQATLVSLPKHYRGLAQLAQKSASLCIARYAKKKSGNFFFQNSIFTNHIY
jgi:hypothetical protein